MGFPSDYEFAGNKTGTTKQIGNAVSVNTAKALMKQLLVGEKASLQVSFEQEVTGDDCVSTIIGLNDIVAEDFSDQ